MTVLQFFCSWKGRINRPTYWGYVIVSLFILLVAGFIIDGIAERDGNFVAFFLFMKLVLMDIAFTVKRLHDTNRSGWCILIGLIPTIGAIYLFVVCGCFKGTEGPNDYGDPDVGLFP